MLSKRKLIKVIFNGERAGYFALQLLRMETISQQTIVKDIVVQDYRTADVFKKYGINYCCGGQVSLEEACRQRKVDMAALQQELESATKNIMISNRLPFNHWRVDFLVDYITNIHHDFIKTFWPSLQGSLVSFVEGHQKKHPELQALIPVFQDLMDVVMKQVKYEEAVVFPYIKQIESMHRRKEIYGSLFVKTLRKPLNAIVNNEHGEINALVQKIRSSTHDYRFPAAACTNHQVIFHKLKELDNDLVQHKHLENNVLFPKAIAIEKELLQL